MGYLLNGEAPETIVRVVRAAVEGEGHFSSPVVENVRVWARGELPGGLTKQELEVLELVAEGLSSKEIAVALGVSVWTVNFHTGNILRKLGVVSRVEAVLWAKERGIFS